MMPPLFGMGHVGLPICSGQNDTTAQGNLLRRAVGGDPLLKLLSFGRREFAGSRHTKA